MKNWSDEEFEVLGQVWATVYCSLISRETSHEDAPALAISAWFRQPKLRGLTLSTELKGAKNKGRPKLQVP